MAEPDNHPSRPTAVYVPDTVYLVRYPHRGQQQNYYHYHGQLHVAFLQYPKLAGNLYNHRSNPLPCMATIKWDCMKACLLSLMIGINEVCSQAKVGILGYG